MKKIKLLLAVLLLVLCAAGCTKKKTDGALAAALEDIKPALLLMDQRYALIQTALDGACAYLSDPNQETREAAKEILVDSIATLPSFTAAKSGLSSKEQNELVKLGLNLADYQVPFETEEYNRVSAVTDLSVLLCLLEGEPTDMAAYEQSLTLLCKNNAVFRQIDFICLNELFCRFQGSEIDAFREEYLPTLTTLSSDGLAWDTDGAALEARAGALMDGAEEDVYAYAEFVGTQYTELLTLQKSLAEIVTDAGYDNAQDVQAMLREGLESFTE